MTYKHTQFSPLVAVIFGSFALLAVALMFITRFSWPAVGGFLILAAGLAVFSRMTTEVGQGRLELRFGLGALRRAIPLDEIYNVRVVATPKAAGLGIHWFDGAWYYNIYGSGAVEVVLKQGEPLVVGSEEPEKLACAVENALMK